ncbi:MAG: outer rane biosis protein [Phycisphaerales bacterium]|nr:outer rane biosis protein [Phycisphaerales bacterium]
MDWRRWAAAIVVVGLSSIAAAEWSEYRGPTHNGISAEKVVWPRNGPRQLWKVPVGEGFGSVATGGGKVFLMAKDEGTEFLIALNADTGATQWTYQLGRTKLNEGSGGDGPRTTPAVDGKHVYIMGSFLNLACVNADSGKLEWSRDLPLEFGGANQLKAPGISAWANAASPIVDGKCVYVYGGGPGQSFIAFDKESGEVVWKSGNELITHATPTLATIAGVRQVIYFTQSGLVSVAADTGNELWRYAYPFDISTASTPVVGGKGGDIVYCSAGYPKSCGADAARITKEGDTFKATRLWQNRKGDEVANHWTTPVYKDGYLYGLFGFKRYNKNDKAPLKCVDIATGQVMWEKPGFGPGGTILAGDDLVVQGDTGQVGLVKATPQGYTPLGGGQVLPNDARCWNAAVVSNGRLYSRSTSPRPSSHAGGFLVCLDVSGK